MTAGALTDRTIVTGVVGDDIHVLGIRLVEHALKSEGAQVVSLGVMTPVNEFIEAAIETAADAVVISSSNGHARLSCEGIRDAFTEAGIGSIRLYIGGNLKVGSRSGSFEEVESDFIEMGFDRVFPPGADLGDAIGNISLDLKGEGQE
jgi:methylaspartate mutase sigma subunit